MMRLIDAEPYRDCRIVANSEDAGIGVKDIPTVDAMPVVHGRWMPAKKEISIGIINGKQCSACKNISVGRPEYGSDFCPDCGAKMDEGGEQNGTD